MKLRFDKNQTAQPVVSQAQIRTRTTKHQKLPIFQILVLMLVLGAVGFGAYQYVRLKNVYAYGIVNGATEEISAPRLGAIDGLQVQRGYHVKQGDLLFTLLPQTSEVEREAEAMVMETLAQARAAAGTEQQNRVAQAAAEVARLQAEYDEDRIVREHAIAIAEVEVAKLADFHAAKKDRLAKYKKLLAMDAAVQSNVDMAENEVQLAQRNLDQARIDLETAKARAVPGEAELTRAKLELERLQNLPEPPELAMDRAKFELDFASKRREPIAFHAPFDGVVMDVHAANGALVSEGKSVITMASTGGVWIDAYIPSSKAVDLAAGQPAHVYVPGVTEPLDGTIAIAPGAATRVPEVLRESMPRVPTATLARVEVPGEARLFPGTIVRIVVRGAEAPL